MACGVGFTMFLVEPNEERLQQMPVHEAAVLVDQGPSLEEATHGKRKAAGAAGGRGKKAKS